MIGHTSIPERFGFDPIRDMQVLSSDEPRRRWRAFRSTSMSGGVRAPSANARSSDSLDLAPGDKVMQTGIDSDEEAYNGDIGSYQSTSIPEGASDVGDFGRPASDLWLRQAGTLVSAYATTVRGARAPVCRHGDPSLDPALLNAAR